MKFKNNKKENKKEKNWKRLYKSFLSQIVKSINAYDLIILLKEDNRCYYHPWLTMDTYAKKLLIYDPKQKNKLLNIINIYNNNNNKIIISTDDNRLFRIELYRANLLDFIGDNYNIIVHETNIN